MKGVHHVAASLVKWLLLIWHWLSKRKQVKVSLNFGNFETFTKPLKTTPIIVHASYVTLFLAMHAHKSPRQPIDHHSYVVMKVYIDPGTLVNRLGHVPGQCPGGYATLNGIICLLYIQGIRYSPLVPVIMYVHTLTARGWLEGSVTRSWFHLRNMYSVHRSDTPHLTAFILSTEALHIP